MSPLDLLFPSPTAPLPDAIAGPVWLLVTGFLCHTGWRIACRLFPEDSIAEILTHTIVLCWATIVLVAILLGLAHLLSGPTLLLGVAVLCGLLRWRIPRPLPRVLSWTWLERVWLAVWVLLLAFWLGHISTAGLFRFPSDWDSLAYHIPFVDHWLQSRSLYAPESARWTDPGNNELLAFWAVAPFSGDFLVSLNNLPATLLLASATIALAGRLGLSPGLSHLAGLVTVCHFVIINQLINAENDVAVAACFAAAAFAGLRATQSEHSADLLLFATSLGLLSGIKFYALGYALVLMVLAMALAIACKRRHRAWRILLWGGLGFLVLGGYWYARNWVVTGSPLFPRELFQHPDTLARIYPDVAATSFLGNQRPELPGLFFRALWQMTGPCQWAAMAFAPATFLYLVGSGIWFTRTAGTASQQGWHRLALAYLLAATLAVLLVTPFAVEDDPGTLNQMIWHYCPIRYGLCVLGMAVLAALVCLADVLAWLTRRVLPARLGCGLAVVCHLGIVGGCLFQMLDLDRRLHILWTESLLIAANLLALLLGLVLLFLQVPQWRRSGMVAIAGLALLGSGYASQTLAARWHTGFVAHYDTLFTGDCFATLAAQESETICVLDFRSYPYFGSRRQFRVWQPMWVPSTEYLSRELEVRELQLVAWRVRNAPGWHRFTGFDECLTRQPQRFQRLSRNSSVTLFHVVPGP